MSVTPEPVERAPESPSTSRGRRALLSGDIRGIQKYIFASPRLFEMRGASRWIDFFDRAVVGELVREHGGEVISAGGGNFLAEFLESAGAEPANERAEACGEALRAAFFDMTSGHPLEIVAHPSDRPFPEARATLHRQMLRAKASSGVMQQLASMPYLRRCESCGQEHADCHITPQGLAPQWVGPACLRKRKMSQQLEEARTRPRSARMPFFHLPSGSYRELEVPQQTQGWTEQANPPSDFLELTDGDDLAVLVADGNGLGGWFDRCDRKSYRELSQTVDRTLRSSVDEAARGVFESGLWRLQILICGGDDLVIALPGADALQFAQRLLRAFRVENTKVSGAVAGMSGGLVFCRPGFPFQQAHHLAEELCGRAKQLCRDGRGEEEPPLHALAFHHVLGSHVQGLAEELSGFRREDSEARRAWSYGGAGPYSLAELEDLQCLKGHLAKVTPSQRGLLRQILAPRGEGAGTRLDPAWGLPRRVLAELRRWLQRQEGELPFEIGAEPDPRLVRIEPEPRHGSGMPLSSLILADALYLCPEGS